MYGKSRGERTIPIGFPTSPTNDPPEPTTTGTETVETRPTDAPPGTTTDERTSSQADPEPTDEELAERHVTNATELFRDFFERWAAYTYLDVKQPTITHVYASSTEYERSSTTDPLFEAEEELDEARTLATFDSRQYDRIMAMRSEREFLMELSRLQSVAVNAFAAIEAELAIWSSESSRDTYRIERHRELSGKLEAVRTQREGLDLAFGDVADSKLAQAEFETERMDDLNSAITRLLSAKRSYDNEDYGEAVDRAGIARRDLRDIGDEVSTPSSYPPSDTIDERFVEHVERWEDEADRLERSAARRQ